MRDQNLLKVSARFWSWANLPTRPSDLIFDANQVILSDQQCEHACSTWQHHNPFMQRQQGDQSNNKKCKIILTQALSLCIFKPPFAKKAKIFTPTTQLEGGRIR